jgi:hypothetical protein
METVVATHCDLRVAFGDARNQGDRPTCLAFALSDAHSAARGATEAMSAEHLYYHAVQRTPGGHPSDGVALPVACDALKLDGQSPETGWPYLTALPSELTHWKPPPGATPLFRRATQPLTPKGADVIARLDTGQPVVLILLLGERFYNPIDGLIAIGPNDADTDYHAVIAVGHGNASTGEACILVRNSWGPDWALEGYGWIALPYLEARLKQTLVMEPGNTP